MSKHRIKAVAVDENELYDEDEYDDGSTADDKEQLRQGTLKVREVLGQDLTPTDEEIQDALWHYYYDVPKSVTYLKNKQKPTEGKKQTAAKTVIPYCSHFFSAKDFFRDCPWLQIPRHRRGDIIIEPRYYSRGLLGGSSKDSKMSKLAALASKRRQKENQPPAAKPDEDNQDHNSAPKKSKLSPPEPSKPVTKPSLPTIEAASSEPETTTSAEQPLFSLADLAATPSAFARTVTGLGSTPQPLTSFSFLQVMSEQSTKSFDFTEPSPEDLFTKAQNAKAAPSKIKSKDTPKTRSDVTNGVANLSVQEPVKIKSKNIDVIAEYKKVKRKNAVSFVVIGHVDAGKSTLMGRLLFDLKAVDQRTMDKYQKEADRIGKGSFAFAWVLDQGTEERARGITMDIATNNFETEKTTFTILDAPGHRDFVPNMIAGASQADFAVLVIDASPSNFESGLKGQTKEHALLVRSIGVQRVIIAVNKMDAAGWSEDRLVEIQQQMSSFLTTVVGFSPKNITFIPCSGLNGDNILRKTTNPLVSWYDGRSLVEELDASEPTTHTTIHKPLRMTVTDVFRGSMQHPISISGRIESGHLQTGETILIQPSGESASIKSLELSEGEPADYAVAGQSPTLNLVSIDPAHLHPGDVVCHPTSPISNVTSFAAKLLAFEHLTPMAVDIHRGRLHVPGRISQLVATLDKSATAGGAVVKKKPKIVQPGSLVRVVVELEAGMSVPLEAGMRIVLRAGGETVAAGVVE